MANSKSDNDGWNVVSDESPTKVVFDTPGEDVFTGTFEGDQQLTSQDGDEFTMWLFRGADGTLYGIQDSYKLRAGLETVKAGQEVRIEYVKNVDVGRPQPMKDFRISVRG